MGTIPARALYMTALEVTKSNVGTTTFKLGYPEPTAAAIANATAGLSAAMAAQLDWIPTDVVSQRLMVQGGDVGCPWRHNLFGPQSMSRLLLPHVYSHQFSQSLCIIGMRLISAHFPAFYALN